MTVVSPDAPYTERWEAAQRLLASGVTRRNTAALVGVGVDTLSRWILGNRKPGTSRPGQGCGTAAGWRVHNRAGETPCQPCREAKNARDRELNRARKAAKTGAPPEPTAEVVEAAQQFRARHPDLDPAVCAETLNIDATVAARIYDTQDREAWA